MMPLAVLSTWKGPDKGVSTVNLPITAGRAALPHQEAAGPLYTLRSERTRRVVFPRVSDDALYRWTLSVLDLRSGEPLGQIDLKGAFPGVAGRVFQRIEADSVTVSPSGKPLRISIRPR